ncbi:MAG: 23S rRNA (guanosine(2251)-2'-O)-methyltransferase RlmB [Gammaproteobacteria bacterium]|nr:23S rRNA (guanosine(2251)-2'-O)-methyltransferase RlmB [Gammaproteobacteria bacterium]
MSQIHGIHAVRALLEGVLRQRAVPGNDAERVRALYVQRGRRDQRIGTLMDLAREAGIRIEVVDKRWLDRRTGGSHQGVAVDSHELALADESALETRLASLRKAPLLLVLDGITDPRNLGACLRSANAAGADAVLLPKRHSAPLNAAALKTAAGGAESLLLIEVTNLARTLAWLKDRGIWIIGAAGAGEHLWSAVDLTVGCALVVGSEDRGLRALTAKSCDRLVQIPMFGEVSSLNVSVATGILLFEAVRQRALASG